MLIFTLIDRTWDDKVSEKNGSKDSLNLISSWSGLLIC
jgi:hypothetical protein